MRILFYGALSNVAWATVLAVAAGLVVRFVRRPALAHSLWILVLLKLIVPGCFALPNLVLAESRPLESQLPANGGGPLGESDLATTAAPTPLETSFGSVEKPSNPPPFREWTWRGAWEEYRVAELLGAVWLAGSGAWLGLAFVPVSRFRRLLT